MKIDRLTTKTREALAAAQAHASAEGHPDLLPEHFFWALLNDSDSLARAILAKANVSVDSLQNQIESKLNQLPKVRGGAEPSLSARLRNLLTNTWNETEALKDEYSSAEHVLLAGFDDREINSLYK